MRLPTTALLCSLPLLLVGAQQASTDDAASQSSASPPGPESLRLLQRIYHPSRPSEPFVDRGALELSYPTTRGASHGPTAATFVPASPASLQAYLTAFAAGADDEAAPPDLDAAVYQLALEHPGDTHPSQWHVSSVRACHVPPATAEAFTLHLSPAGAPYALDYFVGPVPPDGACAGRRGARRRLVAELGSRIANTTVVVQHPSYPPLPQLRTPPPLTAEGKPVTPPQEKSFVQKYWMYFAIAFLAIAVSGAAPEEAQQGGGQGK